MFYHGSENVNFMQQAYTRARVLQADKAVNNGALLLLIKHDII